MISVGSDDGVVRIWSGIYSQKALKLVTGWRAINLEGDLTPIVPRAGAGMVLDWQQKSELVIASGNVDVIKVWDVNKELSVQDIPTNCTYCVTCLIFDKIEDGRLIVAGCADGSIRFYDRRTPPKYTPSVTFMEHRGWVINAFMPLGLNQQVISGSSTGEVKFWDCRNAKAAVKTFLSGSQHPVTTALAVHDYAPLLAIGSQDQRIKVMNFDGEEISIIRYHDGFLGQRIGPVSSLCFHPFKIMLAAGATDSIVSIYAGEIHKPKISKSV